MLVIATPDTVHVRKMVEIARMLNPKIEIVLRTHSGEEAELLRRENAGVVFMGEHELALVMTNHVLTDAGGGGPQLLVDQKRRPVHQLVVRGMRRGPPEGPRERGIIHVLNDNHS